MMRWINRLFGGNRARAVRGRKPTSVCLGVESLEARRLMAAGVSSALGAPLLAPASAGPGTLPPTSLNFALVDRPIDINAGSLIVPALASNPGAPATVYLNFTGDLRNWLTYANAGMSVYDTDGNPQAFSGPERQQIAEIWARVAEHFSPFNVNVTTVDPGNLNNGQTLMVNIGDQTGWFRAGNTGISSTGSFTNDDPNVVYVFTDKFTSNRDSNLFLREVANTAAHEAGHAFGLAHHRQYNADGSVAQEYDPGSGDWAPIMGYSLGGGRHTWGVGRIDDGGNNPVYEYDISYIAGHNGFGYREDGAGHDFAHATRLNINRLTATATADGVIVPNPLANDAGNLKQDFYSFATAGGTVQVRADVLGFENAADLRARVELWSDGRLVAAAGPDAQGNAALSADVAAGKYYVKVMGGGSQYDIGQYTLTISAPPTDLPIGDVFHIGDQQLGAPLTDNTPAARLLAVANILTHSDEYYANFVTAAYQRYLGRLPDAPGLAGWVNGMRHGLSDESIEAAFIGSAEYIANHGGTGAAWVRGLYQDLLGRAPAQAEVDGWVAGLARGVAPTFVAHGFAASAEREAQRVAADYQQYLGRAPAADEVAGWVNGFVHGYSNENVIAGFVGSAEYFGKHGGNAADWLTYAYEDTLGRGPDADAELAWLAYLQNNS